MKELLAYDNCQLNYVLMKEQLVHNNYQLN